MTKSFLFSAIYLLIFTVSPAEGSKKTQAALGRKIDKILLPKKRKSLQAGIVIGSLNTGELLYEKNKNKHLIPASVNKLFTGYTALKVLKPTGTFKTEIFATQPIRNGMLMGDIYIKGSGDPSLVSERMWMLTNELLRSGIKKIKGNIIGDASYFDKERVPKVRPAYLKDQAYNAPVDALSFNFNTTTVYVQPGSSTKSKPNVYIDPQNKYIDIVNQAKTGKRGSRNTLQASRIKHVKGDLGDTILLRGSIPKGNREVRFYRNIVNPTLYTCHMFQQFLERRGVTVDGHVLEGRVPSGARKLLSFDSLPVWQIVWGLNKFSNNFVADQIMKHMGAKVWGPPGSLKKGLNAVEMELAKIGIERGTYKITDGSGLNRKTRITALQIYRLLQSAFKDLSISPEFYASLGVAGVDGTVRRRFLNSAAKAQLRAKTGSLDGTNSLAGIVPSANGEILAFAIILNDPKRRYGNMTRWVDQIASIAAQFKR